jgi:hypothetical protein
LPPHPQPQSPFAFGAGALAEAFGTFSIVRMRSLLLTACLPRVDIALRRASEAVRAVLLAEAPAAARRGAAGRAAGADERAGALT